MYDVVTADLDNPEHASAVLTVLNAYASDPMGGDEPLSAFTQKNLIASLKKRSNIYTILAFDKQEPIGLALCFEGFSTFACKPLLNIHDFAVVPAYRGHGVGKQLLGRVKQLARNLGCCKITLEVLDANAPGKALCNGQGFEPYTLGAQNGPAVLMQCPIDNS
ncbi:GNAT family N-acetyltransferase [Advenella sp. S44]|uniref:GNAT family N-acetyltransferase n=1 Tax=Advenella sp. S44 TaxID=1982755 RepID=UPI000C2A1C8E|nr:GNAT family N-acetyltransferase [Advenella sp. S44]PJX28219.1 GNAT family N-acetyltransferase [Advenella sp. S44]